MKKNISINLQGIIFHIEDDGYDVLSRYLHEVKAHFASYQGHEEIVADIEGRIAELFAARLSATKQVITLADVEELTAKMGRVSDFQTSPDEEDEAYAEPTAAAGPGGSRPAGGPAPREADGEPRRLYRDLAHRKVAGVCAGLAQYFRVNPLVVRFVFLALVLLPNLFRHRFPFPSVGLFDRSFDFSGLAFITYLVLWIALPKRQDAPAPIDTLDFGGFGSSLTGRKLFRDVDAGKVGGVAAGLAAYFRTDVVLVRVLFLLGLFLGGSGFIIYLILWVVMPEARTVSEKMQMRGDAVTLSSIDNSLRSNAFEDDNSIPAGSRSVGTFLEGAARNARPTVSFFGMLIRWAVAGLLIFSGVSWLASVLVALGAALSIIPFSAVEHTNNGFMFGDQGFGSVVRNVQPWGAVAGALATGIPAVALILLGLRLIMRRWLLSRTAGLSLLGLWLLGGVGAGAAGIQVLREFQAKGTYTTTLRLSPVAGPSIVLDSRNLEDHFDWMNLQVVPADSGATPFVEEEFRAKGRTAEAARLTAQQSITYTIGQQDSTITFDQGFQLREEAPFRDQGLRLTLHLPLGKTYRLTPRFIEHLDSDDFTNNRKPEGDQPHRARLTRQGKFTCLDCAASGSDDATDTDEVVNLDADGHKMQVRVNTDGDSPLVSIHTDPSFNTEPDHYGAGRKTMSDPGEFSEVEAHGGLLLLVRQGGSYKVEAAGRPQDLEDLRFDTDGDRLLVKLRGSSSFLGSNTSDHPILVTVTMPRLESLDLSAACQANVSGFRDNDLRVEASSAATALLSVNVPHLTLKLSSASSATLSGTADELSVEGSSASQLNALALRATRATLDMSSASQAKVHATDELTVDLSSGSTVGYTGHPSNISKDLSSGSTLDEL